jgi:prepilin-type N-terminal cleavage/methylation domain-containing protein
MKIKGFTLIELLVVVAIIGILAAVGVVSYNGFTVSAKKSAVLAHHNAFVKQINLVVQQCNIQGFVLLKKIRLQELNLIRLFTRLVVMKQKNGIGFNT